MIGSEDSFDYIPELSITNEVKCIPIACWKDICLSSIWIPSNLLPNRYEPQDNLVTRGIFHTLEKRDLSKKIAGFSVYANSDEEICTSDDENYFTLETDKQNIATECFKNESQNILPENNCTFSTDKSNTDEVFQNDKVILNEYASSQNYNVVNQVNSNEIAKSLNKNNPEIYKQTQLRKFDSHISLNEILDDSPEIDLKAYSCNFNVKNKHSGAGNKTSNQKKKKGKKAIGLDEFLSDYTQQDLQDACCQDFFNRILAEPRDNDNVRIKSTAEFPKLEQDEIKFVHSAVKSDIPSFKFSFNSNVGTVNKSKEISEEVVLSTNEAPLNTCRKIVIENIPIETSEEDIQSLLYGYGTINKFSLETVGKFKTAHVEIEIECEIDWIIECLNGSEPFGASSKTLKCYEQP